MKVSKIIQKIRAKLQDFNEIKFSDYEVLLAINEANQAFRIVCMQELPNIISEELNGTLEGDTINISDGTLTTKILSVKLDDRPLLHNSKYGFKIVYDEGIVIRVCEVPSPNAKYSVRLIREVVELKQDDDFNFPKEIVSFIVDVAVNMLNGGDGATQSALEDKLRYILREFAPDVPYVNGYY